MSQTTITDIGTVGIPVSDCSTCGPGASKAASPRNLFNTKPRSSARCTGGSSWWVP